MIEQIRSRASAAEARVEEVGLLDAKVLAAHCVHIEHQEMHILRACFADRDGLSAILRSPGRITIA